MNDILNNSKGELMDRIRENYLSVALGLLVFLVAITLIFRSAGEITNKSAENESDDAQSEALYTVKKGDSVSSIARDQLGSMDYTDEIVTLNKLKSPDAIEVGQELILPGKADAEPVVTGTEEKGEVVEAEPEKAMTGKVTITGATYTVVKGDYLVDIARRAYGDESMYRKIMTANGIRNANWIEAGMVLKLPR